MSRIISSVILVMLMVGTGCFLTKKEILGEESNKLFSQLVLKICLPALIIQGLTGRFTREGLIKSAQWLGLSFIIIIVLIIASKVIILSKHIKRKALFQISFIFANTIFVGLPVNIALFGDESIPYIFLYYFASTTFFWTYGIYCVQGEGNIREGLKKLLTPTTTAFFIGVILLLFKVPIPGFIATYMKYIGGMTTPLAMLYLGTSMYSLGIKSLKPDFESVIGLVSKFIIAPAIVFIIIKIADGFLILPLLLKKVYFIQTTMPLMTNVAIVSGYYNKSPKEASKLVGLSTILVIVTIPFYAILTEFIF
ncbi:Auxin Efflux Carrier [Ilyobacter polytropus DSM 2926]|uniref:Auxin Efflux Carrier n=1 Tax=Ilyobacter polytropus (strain ATCC 51220 / DSM 2926 / LMG 16218 / CuHBu1) TaxID=572544 RepID=E3H6M5_ILYPC|nr:Auxin Efflux Carrier [Ilyobacter polytropus DSM 2926]